MDAIQAAVLGVKMNYIESWTESRRMAAAHYDRLLAQIPCTTPAASGDCRHVYHVYAIETDRRAALQAALGDAGIGTGIHYPRPVHLQKAYEDLGYSRGNLPVTEALADRLLSLPIYAELTSDQIAEVVAQVSKATLLQNA
jgi:dTDP-4-amino-4,6-dideoxygalactose transaminase